MNWVVAGWGVGKAKGLFLVGQRATAWFGHPCLHLHHERMFLGQPLCSNMQNLVLGVIWNTVMAHSASGLMLCHLQSLPHRSVP